MYIVNYRMSIQMHDAWRRTITSKNDFSYKGRVRSKIEES